MVPASVLPGGDIGRYAFTSVDNTVRTHSSTEGQVNLRFAPSEIHVQALDENRVDARFKSSSENEVLFNGTFGHQGDDVRWLQGSVENSIGDEQGSELQPLAKRGCCQSHSASPQLQSSASSSQGTHDAVTGMGKQSQEGEAQQQLYQFQEEFKWGEQMMNLQTSK